MLSVKKLVIKLVPNLGVQVVQSLVSLVLVEEEPIVLDR